MRLNEVIKHEDLNAAMAFAAEKHSGQMRKGTRIPYIVHPMEVMSILVAMDAKPETVMAGLLHDTVEDTDTSLEEIESLFGPEVSALVGLHSEDKSKSWKARKKKAIAETAKAAMEFQKLILADKLSNMRAIHRDYYRLGDELWDRFNAGRDKQAWYYGGMTDALAELGGDEFASSFYWEFVRLFKDVFVDFHVDEEEGRIYQGVGDEYYVFDRTDCLWKEFYEDVPKAAMPATRAYAERIEDNWKDERMDRAVRKDLSLEKVYIPVCNPMEKSISFSLRKGELHMLEEGWGNESLIHYGKEEYEYLCLLDHKSSYRFLWELRTVLGPEGSLEELLTEAFGSEDGVYRFTQFCIEHKIEYRTVMF